MQSRAAGNDASVGGMITSTIHVLIVTPVIFYIMKVRALRKGRPRASEMAEFIKE